MALEMNNRPIDLLEDLASGISDNTIKATARLWKVTSQHPDKGASVARILHAVAWLAEESGSQPMNEAAGAPSDFSVLLELLDQPEVLDAMRRHDPLTSARIRGFEMKQSMVSAEGGVVSSSEAARMLGVSRQTVDNRRKASRLLAVDLGRHGYAYPAWQFTGDGVLPGLDRVLREFDEGDAWSSMAFFLSGNALLDGTRPLDALREGTIEPVVDAARLYGQHSAL